MEAAAVSLPLLLLVLPVFACGEVGVVLCFDWLEGRGGGWGELGVPLGGSVLVGGGGGGEGGCAFATRA